MPPALYHLKLELYPHLLSASGNTRQSTSAAIHVPAAGSDIFNSDLPAHKRTGWDNESFVKRHSKQNSLSDTATELALQHSRPGTPGQLDSSHAPALLLPERNIALKEGASPALAPVKPSEEIATQDWRFGPVSIDSIDMEASASLPAKRERNAVTPQSKNTASGRHTKGVYVPSDTRTTDVGWGVVHLYKDTQDTLSPEADASTILRTVQASKALQAAGPVDLEQCNTLCLLAVPSWMMPSDLLGFVGDQTREDVSHFRLIRTGRANKYMVLMKFRQAKKAREWQKAWNGALFSAMEPENCHVVFVKSVEFLTPDSDVQDPSAFPQNTHDPFTPLSRKGYTAPLPSTTKPLAPPTPSLVELPTCPVCLERMDETTGLLTILCQHVFHCACLEKWRGSGCPVCRYTQSPSFTFPYPRPTNSATEVDREPSCSVCASTTNLWICLICGNVGCGRYDSAHAFAHYTSTSHCYAMDTSTQHVWDYAGDGYVHRLIQNKDASKLNDPPNSRTQHQHDALQHHHRHPNAAFRAEAEDSVPREKMENMANEYTFLLTSQLEGQRRYFEEQLERAVDKASTASQRAEEAAERARDANTQLDRLRDVQLEQSGAIARLEKSLERAGLRADRFEKLARDVSAGLREEKTMNEGLLARIQAADQRAGDAGREADGLRLEKAELEELNRDLSMFISSQEKVRELQAQGEEVVEGGVGVVESASTVAAGKRKGKGKKK